MRIFFKIIFPVQTDIVYIIRPYEISYKITAGFQPLADV